MRAGARMMEVHVCKASNVWLHGREEPTNAVLSLTEGGFSAQREAGRGDESL